MDCPHCRKGFFEKMVQLYLAKDEDGHWVTSYVDCPSCRRISVYLQRGDPAFTSLPHSARSFDRLGAIYESLLVRPKGTQRPPRPPEVDDTSIAEDYAEACTVLSDSPKASAALSRRCLQHLIREKIGIKKRTLNDEIEAVLESGELPSHIADDLDSVRVIGNFATHPIKSESTGEIVAVEPGEAEWNLDVLESLFDFYYVAPAKAAAKREAMNAKLKDAGKPGLKRAEVTDGGNSGAKG